MKRIISLILIPIFLTTNLYLTAPDWYKPNLRPQAGYNINPRENLPNSPTNTIKTAVRLSIFFFIGGLLFPEINHAIEGFNNELLSSERLTSIASGILTFAYFSVVITIIQSGIKRIMGYLKLGIREAVLLYLAIAIILQESFASPYSYIYNFINMLGPSVILGAIVTLVLYTVIDHHRSAHIEIPYTVLKSPALKVVAFLIKRGLLLDLFMLGVLFVDQAPLMEVALMRGVVIFLMSDMLESFDRGASEELFRNLAKLSVDYEELFKAAQHDKRLNLKTENFEPMAFSFGLRRLTLYFEPPYAAYYLYPWFHIPTKIIHKRSNWKKLKEYMKESAPEKMRQAAPALVGTSVNSGNYRYPAEQNRLSYRKEISDYILHSL